MSIRAWLAVLSVLGACFAAGLILSPTGTPARAAALLHAPTDQQILWPTTTDPSLLLS